MSEHRAEPKARFIPSPKIRRWLYGVGLASAPVLVAYGIIEVETIPLWIPLLGALLGVGSGVALGNVNEDQK